MCVCVCVCVSISSRLAQETGELVLYLLCIEHTMGDANEASHEPSFTLNDL